MSFVFPPGAMPRDGTRCDGSERAFPTSASPEVGKSDQRALPFGIPPAWRYSLRRRALDRNFKVAA